MNMIEMNVEEAVKILRANVMVACDTSDKVGYGTPLNRAVEEALNTVINAVVQQHSDDCLSRQELYKSLYERFHDEDVPNNITMVSLGSVRDFVKDFPPVASVHGTCKNCIHRDPEDKMCDCGHPIIWQLPRPDDWYCADFEKRGLDDD